MPIAALLVSLPLAATAQSRGPSFEFGPEAEARFLTICEGTMSVTPSVCRCLSEGLQRTLGYPAFLEVATGGPPAFAAHSEVSAISALRRAETACLGQAAVAPLAR